MKANQQKLLWKSYWNPCSVELSVLDRGLVMILTQPDVSCSFLKTELLCLSALWESPLGG